ncbi:hypothetical protein SUDANB15_00883 [Streptomyces sp. enrichment culture]|uniref:cellulase n=1 Tax=Streptomyces sp. enrichment culture TaxID=1795815 RepID=UPI003F572C52
MDDFERELTRMMRDTRQQASFPPEQRQRLYEGIRARRRSRMLWRAGGSALAVTGLSVGLALLPWAGSGPTDDRPLPATSPTPPPAVGPTPTASVPGATASTSRPATSPPATADAGTTVPAGGSTPAFAPPPATTAEGERATPTSTPPVPSPPTSPPPSSSEPSGEPSVPAGHESAGSG